MGNIIDYVSINIKHLYFVRCIDLSFNIAKILIMYGPLNRYLDRNGRFTVHVPTHVPFWSEGVLIGLAAFRRIYPRTRFFNGHTWRVVADRPLFFTHTNDDKSVMTNRKIIRSKIPQENDKTRLWKMSELYPWVYETMREPNFYQTVLQQT